MRLIAQYGRYQTLRGMPVIGRSLLMWTCWTYWKPSLVISCLISTPVAELWRNYSLSPRLLLCFGDLPFNFLTFRIDAVASCFGGNYHSILQEVSTKVNNTFNEFNMLSNAQFIESVCSYFLLLLQYKFH